jgi:acyl-CoA reductase-like NAD-dependent aldehyde dehydrogenase
VREAQAIDKRTDVFIKAVERRILVLTDPGAANSKQVQKDAERWGELPKGTRAELLTDIARILDEAINNIDDVATRNAKNPLIPKAVRKLADASTRFLAQLTPLRQQAQDSNERDAIEAALENAQSVVEAANKLPAEVKEKGKGQEKNH